MKPDLTFSEFIDNTLDAAPFFINDTTISLKHQCLVDIWRHTKSPGFREPETVRQLETDFWEKYVVDQRRKKSDFLWPLWHTFQIARGVER
jgi:hypothetical protein